ncbi:MAG: DUF2269 domain-containing protein, partial [Rhodoferax sp.]|uniref:DUF2269 family protein n=1 Tax=Rhodoferax sp. TaxID=50421 RepID=UPI0032641A80
MNLYFTVKWLHILSSVVLVGTGFGSAFYMFFTNRTRNVAAQAVVTRLVVRADGWLTTPTVVLQPATGLLLAHLAGWPLTTPWLWLSAGLFVLAGLCWLPVVWLQIQMASWMPADAKSALLWPSSSHTLAQAVASQTKTRPQRKHWYSCGS